MQEEDLKLDFKREYKLSKTLPAGTNRQDWNRFIQGQWDEFIKDILALTHSNVGIAQKSGHLIIGAADELLPEMEKSLGHC